jgi:hypothetical protein
VSLLIHMDRKQNSIEFLCYTFRAKLIYHFSLHTTYYDLLSLRSLHPSQFLHALSNDT